MISFYFLLSPIPVMRPIIFLSTVCVSHEYLNSTQIDCQSEVSQKEVEKQFFNLKNNEKNTKNRCRRDAVAVLVPSFSFYFFVFMVLLFCSKHTQSNRRANARMRTQHIHRCIRISPPYGREKRNFWFIPQIAITTNWKFDLSKYTQSLYRYFRYLFLSTSAGTLCMFASSMLLSWIKRWNQSLFVLSMWRSNTIMVNNKYCCLIPPHPRSISGEWRLKSGSVVEWDLKILRKDFASIK